MAVFTGHAPRVRQVHTGTVELVAEPRADRSLETLKANLQDRACLLLVMIVLIAQTADVVTTYQALSQRAYVEENPLFRLLIMHSPVAAYSVKVLTIAALMVLAMSYLRGRRAAVALAVAAAISLSAPILNFLLLVHS